MKWQELVPATRQKEEFKYGFEPVVPKPEMKSNGVIGKRYSENADLHE